MKPTLKAPGTKRLKLKYDSLRSIFAFKFNLRRYTMVFLNMDRKMYHAAGIYTRSHFSST